MIADYGVRTSSQKMPRRSLLRLYCCDPTPGDLSMRLLSLLLIIVVEMCAQSPTHPLDSLTKTEYWTVYDTLQQASRITPDTLFASILLHPPAKAAVLSYHSGQPFARETDVVLLRGEKTFAARVDIAEKKV